MADHHETPPNMPVSASAASAVEARLFHDMIGKIGRLPDGVKRVDFRFGEDSEGAPAVWIVFVAQSDLKPSKEKIADMQRVANEVRSEVFRSGSERWPYVEIATE